MHNYQSYEYPDAAMNYDNKKRKPGRGMPAPVKYYKRKRLFLDNLLAVRDVETGSSYFFEGVSYLHALEVVDSSVSLYRSNCLNSAFI